MDGQQERRNGADRRQFAVYYRSGAERRERAEHARGMVSGSVMSDYEMAMSDGYWGVAEEDTDRE